VPAGSDHSYLLPELRLGTAIVFVDRPPRFPDADFVVSDNVDGGRKAAAHLASAGHERIAFLGAEPTIATAEERLRGYREALAERSLAFDPVLVRTGLRTMEDAERATAELLQAAVPPTALFAGQNFFTIGAIRALRALGLERQVAVAGFDDFLLADLLDPPGTVVAQDPSELGRRAAELLFCRLDGDRSPTQRVVCDVRLIARGSGEIAPTARARPDR
jgi:LacI family transcriptional regulator